MKKFHIAIATQNIEATVRDYSLRLGEKPVLVIAGEYALWRTKCLNISIRKADGSNPGELRHLGWEDSEAKEFSEEKDVNGVLWERFSGSMQADEIKELWPEVDYEA